MPKKKTASRTSATSLVRRQIARARKPAETAPVDPLLARMRQAKAASGYGWTRDTAAAIPCNESHLTQWCNGVRKFNPRRDLVLAIERVLAAQGH